ncbi:MAG TPA: inositol monophosphatase family protein, partial [Thermoanaerobaculia bacterium]|nr:inositol monophosphatase family protein [Thermoanaerobaculia bacterium]
MSDDYVQASADLERIQAALAEALTIFSRFTPGEVAARRKSGDDPVTEADTQVDAVLRRLLPQEGEGWLSEETTDDLARLDRRRVWVVDPLDGTREFVEGIPEWSVSVGLVVDGEPVAGGICNPATGETILGAKGMG